MKKIIKSIDYLVIILFFSSILIGLFISLNGKPYVFHPDEIFILKRPFKRVLEYTQLDFSSKFSLYDFFLLIWFGIYFIIGKVLNFFTSFTDFKEQIILEKFHIIYWGRVLSVLFIALANSTIFIFIKHLFTTKKILIFSIFILIFNPVLISSVYWVKYDALMFLCMSIILPLTGLYIYNSKYHLRTLIYFLCFITLSVRIEIVLFIIIFSIYDFVSLRKIGQVFFTPSLFKILGIGIFIYSVFTLHPISFIYNKLDLQGSNLLANKSYDGAISTRLLNNILNNPFGTLPTLAYYLKAIILLIGPFFLYFFFQGIIKNFSKSVVFILHILGFLSIITIFNHKSVHYILNFVLLFLLIPFFQLAQKENKFQTRIFFIQLIYTLTISIPFLIINDIKKDPRFEARDYVIQNTSQQDLVAIETISMHGYHPLIEEEPTVFKKKAELYESINNTPNVGYRLRSESNNQHKNHRRILDVFSTNYLSKNINESNDFINTFDTLHLFQKSPKYFITYRNNNSKFYQYIKKHYTLEKEFTPYSFMDIRCNLLYSYKPSIFIFRKNEN